MLAWKPNWFIICDSKFSYSKFTRDLQWQQNFQRQEIVRALGICNLIHYTRNQTRNSQFSISFVLTVSSAANLAMFTHFCCTECLFRCLCCRPTKERPCNRREESTFHVLLEFFRSACCICANTQEHVMFLLEQSLCVFLHPIHWRAPPTCCATQPEMPHPFYPSPCCLLALAGIDFPNSWPPFSTQINLAPKCQKCSFRHARTHCAKWISVFVAKQLGSTGFHYKSKSDSVLQLSWLWDEAGCVGGSPPAIPHPVRLRMSLSAQNWISSSDHLISDIQVVLPWCLSDIFSETALLYFSSIWKKTGSAADFWGRQRRQRASWGRSQLIFQSGCDRDHFVASCWPCEPHTNPIQRQSSGCFGPNNQIHSFHRLFVMTSVREWAWNPCFGDALNSIWPSVKLLPAAEVGTHSRPHISKIIEVTEYKSTFFNTTRSGLAS